MRAARGYRVSASPFFTSHHRSLRRRGIAMRAARAGLPVPSFLRFTVSWSVNKDDLQALQFGKSFAGQHAAAGLGR
jgi:hypothetical protein